MEKIIILASSVFLSLIVAGFFLGFARDWCRSLIRFVIVLLDFALSLLISPVLTSAFLGKFSTGTTLNLFNYNIDFSQIAEGMFEANLGEDLTIVSSEIQMISKALINIALNVVLFLILFFLILFLSLIIYWVVLIIVKNVSKHSGENKEKTHISTRFIGGAVGTLTTLIIGFALLIPLFGAMDICNKFLVNNTEPKTENVASAVSTGNLLAGQLYYTEDKKIGKFENYIEQYSYIKSTYDKSFVGKIFNFTRLGKAGSAFFDYLTRVKYKDETVKFSDEISAAIDSYNTYKEVFKDKEFDITNNNSLDGASSLVAKLTRSKVMSGVVESVMPQVLKNWAKGDKFLGIEIKTSEATRDLVHDLFETVITMKTASRLNYNFNIVVEAMKNLNDQGVISSIKNGEALEKLKENDSVVKNFVLRVSESEEIKNRLPILIDDAFEMVYKMLTGEDNYTNISSETQINITDQQKEAEAIQKVTIILLEIKELLPENQNNTENPNLPSEPETPIEPEPETPIEPVKPSELEILENGETSGTENDLEKQNNPENPNESEDEKTQEIDMFTLLELFGELIDVSRESALLSEPVKNFMNALFKSEKFASVVLTESGRDALISYINGKWNEEESDFKFKELFGVVSKFGKLSEKVSDGESIVTSELKTLIEEIINNAKLKINLIEFFDTNVIDDLISNDEYKIVAFDMFKETINNSTTESLDKDIKSVASIVELANSLDEFNNKTAEENLVAIAGSDIIMNYIDNNSNIDGNSNLQKIVDYNLNGAERAVFAIIIQSSENLTDNQKLIFSKLFINLGL